MQLYTSIMPRQYFTLVTFNTFWFHVHRYTTQITEFHTTTSQWKLATPVAKANEHVNSMWIKCSTSYVHYNNQRSWTISRKSLMLLGRKVWS